MHFVEIANLINENKFDKKKANPATVHNELILDKKYVLVGRGIYALKEWGYQKGTVADVILEIMKEKQSPMSKQEVVDEVLKQRMVKKTTIHIALLNRKLFKKADNHKFYLVDTG